MASRAPGVQVKAKPAGSQPIQGVGTATAAFVGVARQGPQSPTEITSWPHFRRTYGDDPVEGSYLHETVFGFFENGGRRCFVVNLFGTAPIDDDKPVTTRAEGEIGPFTVRALQPGDEGNGLTVEVTEPAEEGANAEEQFRVVVRRGDEVIAEADGLRLTGHGPPQPCAFPAA